MPALFFHPRVYLACVAHLQQLFGEASELADVGAAHDLFDFQHRGRVHAELGKPEPQQQARVARVALVDQREAEGVLTLGVLERARPKIMASIEAGLQQAIEQAGLS